MKVMTTCIGPPANAQAARYSQTGNRTTAPANERSPAAEASDNGMDDQRQRLGQEQLMVLAQKCLGYG